MAHLARNYDERQEFWKPAIPPREEAAPSTGQVCDKCGTDFLMGSRFCHICGADRHINLTTDSGSGMRKWLDFVWLREGLGQNVGSLVALALGIVCVVAAILTGFLYSATTVLDWQAIQIWRIEWLLAAVAMFVGGLLLKKK